MHDFSPFHEYIKRTEEIRTLSTLPLDHINSADDYRNQLRSNFTRIGELAAKNRDFLDRDLFPMIGSEELIDEEDAKALLEFTDALINAENAENLDLSIVSVIQEKLVSDATRQKDLENSIRYRDTQMSIYYELMFLACRIKAYPEIAESYRQKGLKLVREFRSLLSKDFFLSLKDPELRDIVLTNVRYGVSFYEGLIGDEKRNEEQIQYMKDLYAIAEDPFYIKVMGEDFDWVYYRFRLLQYSTCLTETNNQVGLNDKQIEFCYEHSVEMVEFWEENLAYIRQELSDTEDYNNVLLTLVRNRYLTHRISREAYLEELLAIYDKRDPDRYNTGAYYTNLAVPREIISLLGASADTLSEREKSILVSVYKNVLSYAFYMPNDTGLFLFLEIFYQIIEVFVEIPSAITFENMMLQSMAAMHPPTYVHSKMVGKLTECLCTHLLRLMPEKLIGVCGTKTVEEVCEKRGEIIQFAYHAALCHDCGKLSIIDVVFIYGRRLLDMEFDLIKTHPKTGYELLKRHASTRDYAEVALGHHKWYDDSRGYPEEFATKDSAVKPVIDLVLCADCLDAATDTVGRSYSRGKSLDAFTEELKEGQNERYAPWLLDLFSDEAVKKDINYLLEEGRQQKYSDIYYLLKDIHERSNL